MRRRWGWDSADPWADKGRAATSSREPGRLIRRLRRDTSFCRGFHLQVLGRAPAIRFHGRWSVCAEVSRPYSTMIRPRPKKKSMHHRYNTCARSVVSGNHRDRMKRHLNMPSGRSRLRPSSSWIPLYRPPLQETASWRSREPRRKPKRDSGVLQTTESGRAPDAPEAGCSARGARWLPGAF